MLISFRRLDGKKVDIDSAVIFRARPAISIEPGARAVIHYDPNPLDKRYETLASNDSLKDIANAMATALQIAALHAPNGSPVILDANKVSGISPAISGLHYPGTKAVVTVFGQIQQVAESVADARRIIAAARAASGSA